MKALWMPAEVWLGAGLSGRGATAVMKKTAFMF